MAILLAAGHRPFIEEMRADSYSQPVRTRALALLAFDEGMTAQEVAESVNVSQTWAGQLRKIYREKGIHSFPANARRRAVSALGSAVPTEGPASVIPSKTPPFLAESHRDLLQVLTGNSFSAATQRRARILLLYDEGMKPPEVQSQLGLSYMTVIKWRREYRLSGLGIFSNKEIERATQILTSGGTDGEGQSAAQLSGLLLLAQHRPMVAVMAREPFREKTRRRATILLAYDDGLKTREVQAATGLGNMTVTMWRREYRREGLGIFDDRDLQRARSEMRRIEAGESIQEEETVETKSHLLEAGHRVVVEALASGSYGDATQRRARIILAFDDGKNSKEVQAAVSMSYLTVVTWRRRYRDEGLGIFHERDLQRAQHAVALAESGEEAPADVGGRLLAAGDRPTVDQLASKTFGARVQNRARALLMADDGAKTSQINDEMGNSYGAVSMWLRNYRKEGLVGTFNEADVDRARQIVAAGEAGEGTAAQHVHGHFLDPDHRSVVKELSGEAYRDSVRRRANGLLRLDEGVTAISVAEELEMSYASVASWRSGYRTEGLESIPSRALAAALAKLAGEQEKASDPVAEAAPAPESVPETPAAEKGGGALLEPGDRALMQELTGEDYSPKTQRRAKALLALDDGKTGKAVKDLVGVSYNTINNWRNHFRKTKFEHMSGADVAKARLALGESGEALQPESVAPEPAPVPEPSHVRVLLSAEDRAMLEEWRDGAGNYKGYTRRRANLLLLYDDGLTTVQVVETSNMSSASANLVRNNYRLTGLQQFRDDDIAAAREVLARAPAEVEPPVDEPPAPELVETPLPVEEEVVAVVDEPEAVVEEAAPVEEEAETVVEVAETVVEVAAPVEEEAETVVEVAVPVVEEAETVVEVAAPAEEEAETVVEVAAPVVEEAAPVKEKAKPKKKRKKKSKGKRKKGKKGKKKKPTPAQPNILVLQGLEGIPHEVLARGTGQLYILLAVQRPK